MESLSTTWFSWFAESTSEPTGIRTRKLGKTILIVEISPSALLLEATVPAQNSELHKASLVGKKTAHAFRRHQVQPDPSTGRPSTFNPKKVDLNG